jgi:tetratricopeptide repeat protein 30
LQSAIDYEQDQLSSSKAYLDQCSSGDPDVIVAHGCLHYKEGDYTKAAQSFSEAINSTGNSAVLSYNVALCHYRMKMFGPAMKNITEIIERGVREHPGVCAAVLVTPQS